MADFEPWKRNRNGDPDYPWYSCRNEKGAFTYWIPLECPNRIPVDDRKDAEKYIYSNLPLFGGKRLNVVWAETTSREWAYDQKRWIDAEAKRNERRLKREIPVEEVLGDGSDDGNRKKEWLPLDGSSDNEPAELMQDPRESDDETDGRHADQNGISEEAEDALDVAMEEWQPADVPEDQKDGTPEAKANGRKRICDCTPYSFPQTEPQAINRIELESVTAYLRTQNPRSWQVFCLKEWYGIGAEEIAEKFDITPSRIYQLVGAVQKLGKKYRQENL